MNGIFLPLIMILLMGSCSDFLDVDEQTKISNDQLFSSVQGTAEALSSAYYMLGSLDYYGRNMMVIPDLKGGNLRLADPANGNPMSYNHKPAYEFNHSEDPTDDYTNRIYEQIYQVIMSVNNIMDYIPYIENASEDEKNQLMAEARAIRALAHFDLTRFFSQPYAYSPNAEHPGVAYVQKVLGYSEKVSRDPLYKNYNEILEDLEFAEEHIGASLAQRYAGSNMSYYSNAFFSKAGVQALMARVYLYKNDWTNARGYASKVINSSGASLEPYETFVERFVSNNPSSEDLLIVNNEGRSSGAPLASLIGFKPERTSNYLIMSDDLLQMFDPQDRRTEYFQWQLDGTICRKYTEYTGAKDHYIPVIRLAEVYLIRAEACLNLPAPDEVQARADLDRIRRRANPDAAALNLSGEALREELFRERRRELAVEGHLFFDIARTKRDVVREDTNAEMNRNLSFGDFRYILPIPQKAITLNDKMIQNEGY
ncbi:MAG: RagB/SusD family nutrient uptake outer membrane protein [Bacteroidales bacterium]